MVHNTHRTDNNNMRSKHQPAMLHLHQQAARKRGHTQARHTSLVLERTMLPRSVANKLRPQLRMVVPPLLMGSHKRNKDTHNLRMAQLLNRQRHRAMASHSLIRKLDTNLLKLDTLPRVRRNPLPKAASPLSRSSSATWDSVATNNSPQPSPNKQHKCPSV